MSVRVFLKSEGIKNVEGFETLGRENKKTGQKWNEYRFSGISLSHENGRWYFHLDEPTYPIPTVVKEIVEEISLYETIPAFPKREWGIYRHESAEAHVEKGYDQQTIRVKILGKKIEDVNKLFQLIRIGSIRPSESFEGKQSGMSRKELEDQVATLEGAYKRLHTRHQNLRRLLMFFDTELSGKLFCRISSMRSRIKETLDSDKE